jgi:hypothetical protein
LRDGEGPGSDRRVLALMVAVVVLVPLVFAAARREPAGWTAAYFAGPDFSGPPVVRKESDPGRGRRIAVPQAAGRDSVYSARWETVLKAGEGGRVAFMLTANGGSRLLIDGRVAVDNWGPPDGDRRTRGARFRLPAGEVRITVEHVALARKAFLSLAVSLDGAVPKRIPAARLRVPDESGLGSRAGE